VSRFICSACGAAFEGRFEEVVRAGFEHTAAHGEPAQKPSSVLPPKLLEETGESKPSASAEEPGQGRRVERQ